MHLKYKEKLKKIKLLILDVDGVLTDGKIIYSSEGEKLKFFNVHDGYGINKIQKEGIIVAIITGRTSDIVIKRAKDLNINDIYQGNINKLPLAEDLAKKYNLKLSELAFMGDEMFDIPLLQKVGFAAAPANARKEVKRVVHFVTKASGGDGAVRELIDLILQAKNIED